MTKEEMLKEVTFPILGDSIYKFFSFRYEDKLSHPSKDAWILCTVEVKGITQVGIYKWQLENYPKNITSYCYINIYANTGLVRYVEYPHLQDEKVIVIIDEKQKDLIIKPREKK